MTICYFVLIYDNLNFLRSALSAYQAPRRDKCNKFNFYPPVLKCFCRAHFPLVTYKELEYHLNSLTVS